MEPSNNLSKIINFDDENSLKNLAMIHENEVIDVYENGTVSKPYNAASNAWDGLKNAAWRTGRSVTLWSSNRNDLHKIQELLKRSIICYINSGTDTERRSDKLLNEIEGAVHGLETLKDYYVKKDKDVKESKEYWSSWGALGGLAREKIGKGDCEQAINNIDEVIKNVNSNLEVVKNTGFASKLKPDRRLELHQMEASNLHGTKEGFNSLTEVDLGIDYYSERIKLFLLLNKVNDSDRKFLEELDVTLNEARGKHPGTIYHNVMIPKMFELREQGSTDDYGEAMQYMYNVMSEEQLQDLDMKDKQIQSEIGICMNMTLNWDQNNGVPVGHYYAISVCKEQDGTYTIAQANAGGLSLGNANRDKLNLKTLYDAAVGLYYPPIVEFSKLTRDEAKNFLNQANQLKFADRKYNTFQEASDAYNSLFGLIKDKRNAENRIPDRRTQSIGNCGLRSLKEEIIYAFQKAGKIELANQFLKHIAETHGLGLDEVKPLK